MRNECLKYGLDIYGTHMIVGNELESICIWVERDKVRLKRMDCMWVKMGFHVNGQECKLGTERCMQMMSFDF